MNTEDKLILYWSGEADEALAEEVEEILEKDEGARAYLETLGDFALALKDEKIPGPREGLLEEVLNEATANKVINFPQGVWWGAVAAVFIVAAALIFVKEDNKESPPTVAELKEEPRIAPRIPKLSERLMTETSSFREGKGMVSQVRRERERWETLRTWEKKI
ncbi:MAG: hypothetical protein AAGA96_11090 [Verrucomicrobiota bacterium]